MFVLRDEQVICLRISLPTAEGSFFKLNLLSDNMFLVTTSHYKCFLSRAKRAKTQKRFSVSIRKIILGSGDHRCDDALTNEQLWFSSDTTTRNRIALKSKHDNSIIAGRREKMLLKRNEFFLSLRIDAPFMYHWLLCASVNTENEVHALAISKKII